MLRLFLFFGLISFVSAAQASEDCKFFTTTVAKAHLAPKPIENFDNNPYGISNLKTLAFTVEGVANLLKKDANGKLLDGKEFTPVKFEVDTTRIVYPETEWQFFSLYIAEQQLFHASPSIVPSLIPFAQIKTDQQLEFSDRIFWQVEITELFCKSDSSYILKRQDYMFVINYTTTGVK